jgi:hypothetical protein
VEDDDWRLMGQERYLLNKPMRLRVWKSPKPSWDHDHCEFCTAKIWDHPEDGEFAVAYVTADEGDHWVCPPCFEDFQSRFGWTIEPDGAG